MSRPAGSQRSASAAGASDDDAEIEGHALGGGALIHPPGHVPHLDQGPYETGYLLLTVVFVSMLVLTNIIGLKLFALPVDLPLLAPLLALVGKLNAAWFGQPEGAVTLTLTAGIITYPITFLCTDVVSEVYGRKRADRMVLVGFCASLLMLAVVQVARALPASEFWNVPAPWSDVIRPDLLVASGDGAAAQSVGNSVAAQSAFSFAFDAPGTLLLASMTAYLVAQLVDNRLFHFWRRLTAGRHLWLRNNMSTAVSQLVDTVIVNGIFLSFYWKFEWDMIAAIILSSYAVKFSMALLDTPLCYLGVWWARRLVTPGLTPGARPTRAV